MTGRRGSVLDGWGRHHTVGRRSLLAAPTLLAGLPRPSGAQGARTEDASRDPPQEPFLRIEAGAHIAPLSRLATDAAGRTLATVSDDKTLRLWNLPEGTLRSVIRPPMGPGAEGELYAVALTPDGSRVFVGGFTARSWDGAFAIYVFETESGRLTARLSGLPAPVHHLALSADGSRLAAGLAGRAGVRVWDAANGRLQAEDTSYGAAARTVAFSAAGQLASTSADGLVRVYDQGGRKTAERAPVPGARPYGLAWSPDGTMLAVGFEDRLRVDLLAVADLRSVFTPDVTGLQGEGLPAVAWSSNGRGGVQVFAGGYARGPGGFVVRRWADYGLGTATDIVAARDAISHLIPAPGGGVLFAAADPGWGRVAPDGTLAQAPRAAGGDGRAGGRGLAASPDGLKVRFALSPEGPPLVFDVAAGRLEAATVDVPGLAPGRTESARLTVLDWRDSNRPRLRNTALRLTSGEYARSVAITPGEEGFFLGSDGHLRLFDAAGRVLHEVTTPGTVWGLVATARGAVAMLGDATIRWYEIAEGRLAECAALFVHADARRWALWTPDGLFDHAPSGGQDLVGVHLNGGRAQTAEWASFAQAYRALFAPAAVRARIAGNAAPARDRMSQLGDARARIARQPVLQGRSVVAVTPDGQVPLAWGTAEIPPGTTALRLSLAAQDRGLGLGPVDVMLNDRLAARADPERADGIEVTLDPGGNRIATRLYTEDRSLFAEGPTIEVRRAGEAEVPAEAGRLYVLSVGVDGYANPELNLRYAVADARSVAEALRDSAGGIFRSVSVRLVTDAAATREGVLAALAAAASEVRPADTFVFYLAGHGVLTEPDNRFLFLPHDTRDTSSWAALRRQGIGEEALVSAISRISARDGLLLVDTCYAGQIAVDSLAAIGNDTGRFLLTASTSLQQALDSYDNVNGVFGYAVLEGLRGRAATDAEGRVSALALGEWVTRRVPQLAAEKRFNQNAVFRTARRDLRSFAVASVRR